MCRPDPNFAKKKKPVSLHGPIINFYFFPAKWSLLKTALLEWHCIRQLG